MKQQIGLGTRMKEYYEFPYQTKLPRRMPVIIRIDGKAFHTLTKDMVRPFDETFFDYMLTVAQKLVGEVQGCELAYGQSDEISFLMHNYKRLETSAWFDNEVQKLCSITASLASTYFTKISGLIGAFDARVFVLPEDEVANYFIWRQEDAKRNSVQMVAQSLYSHKQLHGKKNNDLLQMISNTGIDYATVIPIHFQRGYCIKKLDDSFWYTDLGIPEFKNERKYVEEHLRHE